uniref:Uncharacterized protein n=1 Tax=Plectus sambesii TaxID=2011161 RepID=A0A914UU20_9BILA
MTNSNERESNSLKSVALLPSACSNWDAISNARSARLCPWSDGRPQLSSNLVRFFFEADKSDGRGSRIGSDHKKSSRANAVSTSTTTSTSESSKPSSSTTQSIPSVPMQIRLDEPKSSESIQDEGSVVGTTQQTSSSVSEQAVTAQKTSESESTSQVPTVGASSSSTTSKTSSKTTIKEAASDRSKSESSSSLSDRRKSWPNRRHKSQSKDVDSMSASFSGDTEIETRIQALKANLAEKRQLASKLKREHNRRTKEHLISTEQSLAKQIEAYDKYIKQTQDTLYDLEKSTVSGSISRPGTPPRIRSPRTSLEGSRQGSPTKIVSPRRVPGSPTKGSFDWNHSAEVVDEVG